MALKSTEKQRLNIDISEFDVAPRRRKRILEKQNWPERKRPPSDFYASNFSDSPILLGPGIRSISGRLHIPMKLTRPAHEIITVNDIQIDGLQPVGGRGTSRKRPIAAHPAPRNAGLRFREKGRDECREWGGISF